MQAIFDEICLHININPMITVIGTFNNVEIDTCTTVCWEQLHDDVYNVSFPWEPVLSTFQHFVIIWKHII